MIKSKINLSFLSIAILFCIKSEAEINLESLMAVLYSQTSGEIKATFVQTYNTAEDLLDTAIEDKNWDAVLESERRSERTPAIILDVDETVLDNTPFNARSIMNSLNSIKNPDDDDDTDPPDTPSAAYGVRQAVNN